MFFFIVTSTSHTESRSVLRCRTNPTTPPLPAGRATCAPPWCITQRRHRPHLRSARVRQCRVCVRCAVGGEAHGEGCVCVRSSMPSGPATRKTSTWSSSWLATSRCRCHHAKRGARARCAVRQRSPPRAGHLRHAHRACAQVTCAQGMRTAQIPRAQIRMSTPLPSQPSSSPRSAPPPRRPCRPKRPPAASPVPKSPVPERLRFQSRQGQLHLGARRSRRGHILQGHLQG